MAYKYIIHELTQQEYETSLQWYAERSKRAAENFITAVNDALHLICASPTRWRNSYKSFYELGLKKYPFTIIYTIEPGKQLIMISSIYHYKRNPKKRYRK
jgi:plasmid stabilization system protein ParE